MCDPEQIMVMEQELNVLRRVVLATQRYRNAVMAKRSLQAGSGISERDLRMAELEIGSVEFELTDLLQAWERLNHNSG